MTSLPVGRVSDAHFIIASFVSLTGLSPHDFVNQLRIQSAMDLLRTSEYSIIEIAERSGFQSLSSFNKQFRAYAGCSPRDYRNRSYLVT